MLGDTNSKTANKTHTLKRQIMKICYLSPNVTQNENIHFSKCVYDQLNVNACQFISVRDLLI